MVLRATFIAPARLPLPASALAAWMAAACSSDGAGNNSDVPDVADIGAIDATDAAGDDTDIASDADADASDVSDIEAGDTLDVAPDTTNDPTDAAADPEPADTAADTPDTQSDPVGDIEPDGPPAAWLRVGTGYDPLVPYAGYTPLGDGDPVRIAEGPQGGFHVWGGFEGAGLPPRDVESEWTLTTADGVIIGGGYFVSDMQPYEDHLATAGLTVFLDISLDVTTLDGPRYDLCATVYLADDSTLTDCRSVTTSCCDYL